MNAQIQEKAVFTQIYYEGLYDIKIPKKLQIGSNTHSAPTTINQALYSL